MKTTREILTDLDLIYGRNLLKEEKYKIVDYVKKYAKEYHESELKKLRVTDVSGQSKLLESFVKFVNERQFNQFQICLDEVELFLDSNCH